jgi:hypothetical protein
MPPAPVAVRREAPAEAAEPPRHLADVGEGARAAMAAVQVVLDPALAASCAPEDRHGRSRLGGRRLRDQRLWDQRLREQLLALTVVER